MIFHSDGIFEFISPGRDDRPVKDRGRWQSMPGETTRISVSIEGANMQFDVVEVTDGILRIEQLGDGK